MISLGDIKAAVRVVARRSPDLLKKEWRERVEAGAHPLTGHCYVVCEVLWHVMGGLEWRFRPHTMRHEGAVHWFLKAGDEIIDPTVEQFATPPDYAAGRCRGFLTSRPSRRAQVMMGRTMLANAELGHL